MAVAHLRSTRELLTAVQLCVQAAQDEGAVGDYWEGDCEFAGPFVPAVAFQAANDIEE